MDTQRQIERLKAEIARQEAELPDLEAAVLDSQQELREFTARYDREIQPLRDRLQIIREMIADLEAERQGPPPQLGNDPRPLASTWTPPPGYVPVEEQFRQAWEVPRQKASLFESSAPPPPTIEIDERDPKQALKRLYRQLARRYHPDLTTDPDERERRNRLMAEINAAYSDGNLDALKTLAAQPDTASLDQPLSELQLRQLQQIHDQLTRRIDQLRFERHDLLNGEMMALKLQATLAAHKGRDLLREMAAGLERDYRAALDRLDQLRGSA